MENSINTFETTILSGAAPLAPANGGRKDALSSERRAAVNWSMVSFMALLHAGAAAALFHFSWQALAISLFLLWLGCSVGICVGYHRLLSHRSYRTPKWIEYSLAVCGTLAMQGGPIFWAATHRIHHANADRPGDPHSPRDGFWWAHLGWMVRGETKHDQTALLSRYAPDLAHDRFYVWLSRWHFLPQLILGLALFALGGWGLLLWGVFLRAAVGLHITWLVASVGHKYGARRFRTRDDSTNNFLVGLIGFGDGWHNNHHAFPWSARHGLAWYEFDPSWWAIRGLQLMGVATQVKTPGLSAQAEKLLALAAEHSPTNEQEPAALSSERWAGINLGEAAVVALIHAGAAAALFLLNWRALFVAAFLYWIAGGLGVCVGYHRLLTHRGFKAPKWFEYFLAVCGTLAMEGGPVAWAATHRRHHANADRPGDPHSPRDGFWWAHISWVFTGAALHNDTTTASRHAPDLAKDRFYLWLTRWHFLPTLLLGVVLYAWGGWPMAMCGVFLRVACCWHATWLVNSATHRWGRRRFPTRDDSRNCWWVALLTFGEGWHNNHHAHPASARHGLAWYEVDPSWWVIRTLSALRLAKEIRLTAANPPREAQC